MYQTGCNVYRQTAANTVEDKRMILLKLYQGALVFIRCAQRGIMDNSPQIRGENISKAMAIINELECALDHEKGGDISARLGSLYQYATQCLLHASLHNDTEALEQVKQLITTLKEGFEGAIQSQKSTTASPQAIPTMPAPEPQPQRPVQFAL
jgi:flagellar protein FliS